MAWYSDKSDHPKLYFFPKDHEGIDLSLLHLIPKMIEEIRTGKEIVIYKIDSLKELPEILYQSSNPKSHDRGGHYA